MGAILNGMVLHGGFRVYGSTFFVFSDYMRPTIRLAALVEPPVIYVFTHDSFYVGEDGPTHQPVEHAERYRLFPGSTPSARPMPMKQPGTRLLVYSGPMDPLLSSSPGRVSRPFPALSLDGFKRVSYVISEPEGGADLVLIATGSEVSLALDALRKNWPPRS